MVSYLADECFSGPLFRALQSAGFDIIRSADIAPGADDNVVLSIAFAQGRVVLTEDNDFGDLTVRLNLPTHGLVRVDLKPLSKLGQLARCIKAMTDLGEKARGALVTIEPTRTRVRQLVPPATP